MKTGCYRGYWRMSRIIACFVIIIIALWACAHHKDMVEVNEYNNISNQLKLCRDNIKSLKKENAELKEKLNLSNQEMQSLSSKLKKCLDKKQCLLDENIKCLEESKMLIAQIANFKGIIHDKRQAKWRLNKDYEYIISFLDKERLEGRVSVIKESDNIKIVIPQRMIFPTARSAWLTPRGNRLIKKIAQGMKVMKPGYIQIAGHTDNTPIPEGIENVYPTNWHLGLARALSVLMVFEVQGIQKDKLCAISYGETKPIADNSSSEGRAMNRRVEIAIIP